MFFGKKKSYYRLPLQRPLPITQHFWTVVSFWTVISYLTAIKKIHDTVPDGNYKSGYKLSKV
jgi:hypothetical protein